MQEVEKRFKERYSPCTLCPMKCKDRETCLAVRYYNTKLQFLLEEVERARREAVLEYDKAIMATSYPINETHVAIGRGTRKLALQSLSPEGEGRREAAPQIFGEAKKPK